MHIYHGNWNTCALNTGGVIAGAYINIIHMNMLAYIHWLWPSSHGITLHDEGNAASGGVTYIH